MLIVPIHLYLMDIRIWIDPFHLASGMIHRCQSFECRTETHQISLHPKTKKKHISIILTDLVCFTPLRCLAHVLKSTHVRHGFCSVFESVSKCGILKIFFLKHTQLCLNIHEFLIHNFQWISMFRILFCVVVKMKSNFLGSHKIFFNST